MAPERFTGINPIINISLTEGDVYSLAMTSFKVCFSVGNCCTITPLRSGPHGDIAIR
jgi:hypothetical protein